MQYFWITEWKFKTEEPSLPAPNCFSGVASTQPMALLSTWSQQLNLPWERVHTPRWYLSRNWAFWLVASEGIKMSCVNTLYYRLQYPFQIIVIIITLILISAELLQTDPGKLYQEFKRNDKQSKHQTQVLKGKGKRINIK